MIEFSYPTGGLGVGVVGRAEHGHEQLGLLHLAAGRNDDGPRQSLSPQTTKKARRAAPAPDAHRGGGEAGPGRKKWVYW